MSSKSLQHFFNPTAVAVIGASRDRKKIGRQILDNIISGGFTGKIYPVNLEGGRIAGLSAYRTVADIPGKNPAPILAVIAIPAAFVFNEIKKCAARGIKNIIVISAGFKESGMNGRRLEEEIAIYARAKRLNLLGPNCLGLVSSVSRLNATFSAACSGSGRIALLSQSGAIGSAALDWLRMKKLNFRYFVSLGNKAVLSENQILDYLQTDHDLDLVVTYLEEIDNGEQLVSLISRLSKRCPVAVLKAGISQAGSRLARSHTGALAGSTSAVRAGLERAGAIWLDNLGDLFNLLTITDSAGRLAAVKPDQKMSLITNAGGLAVLAVDEISRSSLPFGRSEDLLGDADAKRYQTALNRILKDKSVNPLLVMLTPQTATEPVPTAQAIIRAARRYPDKMILASFVGGTAVNPARALLQENNIPVFDYPEEAIASWAKVFGYQEKRKLVTPYQPHQGSTQRPLASGDYLESFRLLKRYGIPSVSSRRYDDTQLRRYSYPAVLKLVGPAAWHKTDRGGVILNLKNAAALKAAALKLKKDNRKMIGTASAYLAVQPQVSSGREMIIGFKRDESFGPLILVGQGGIYTEIAKDLKITTGDLNQARALSLIKSLNIYPVLNGLRGQKKYNIAALARALVSLSRLAKGHPEIKELDINPLFITGRGVAAGDVRIII